MWFRLNYQSTGCVQQKQKKGMKYKIEKLTMKQKNEIIQKNLCEHKNYMQPNNNWIPYAENKINWQRIMECSGRLLNRWYLSFISSP